MDSLGLKLEGRVLRRKVRYSNLTAKAIQAVLRPEMDIYIMGGSCFGASCGLQLGDKVRIKVKHYGRMIDTLRIEKCQG